MKIPDKKSLSVHHNQHQPFLFQLISVDTEVKTLIPDRIQTFFHKLRLPLPSFIRKQNYFDKGIRTV